MSFAGKRKGMAAIVKGEVRRCVTCGGTRGELVPYGKRSLHLFQHTTCAFVTRGLSLDQDKNTK
jgi:hypothetical protein